jgi:hypothetical protein
VLNSVQMMHRVPCRKLTPTRLGLVRNRPKVMNATSAKADIHQERHRNSVCNRACSQRRKGPSPAELDAQNQ